MSNSAISFNTAGLASTTSPGLVGTGAQTFAGKKTLDGGALIKGDTSGVAIATGYVGEIQEALQTSSVNGSSTRATYTTLVTLSSLSAGIWRLEAYCPLYSIQGASNDTGGPSQGAIFTARIFNVSDSSILYRSFGAMAKSTVNGGFVTGGPIFMSTTINLTSAKTYRIEFAYLSNSGSNVETASTITASAFSDGPAYLRATRIA